MLLLFPERLLGLLFALLLSIYYSFSEQMLLICSHVLILIELFHCLMSVFLSIHTGLKNSQKIIFYICKMLISSVCLVFMWYLCGYFLD